VGLATIACTLLTMVIGSLLFPDPAKSSSDEPDTA
jgi:hypothetical protein